MEPKHDVFKYGVASFIPFVEVVELAQEDPVFEPLLEGQIPSHLDEALFLVNIYPFLFRFLYHELGKTLSNEDLDIIVRDALIQGNAALFTEAVRLGIDARDFVNEAYVADTRISLSYLDLLLYDFDYWIWYAEEEEPLGLDFITHNSLDQAMDTLDVLASRNIELASYLSDIARVLAKEIIFFRLPRHDMWEEKKENKKRIQQLKEQLQSVKYLDNITLFSPWVQEVINKSYIVLSQLARLKSFYQRNGYD